MIKRCELNPILTAKNIPYDADLIFNAGVIKLNGEYIMLFRNDYLKDKSVLRFSTNLGIARSKDGIHFKADPKPCFQMKTDEIMRIYDPRLQIIDGEILICFAMDTKHGLRGGIAKTDKEFKTFEIMSLSAPDNRNMVLFPEKINGKYARLERPLPVYSTGGDYFDIWFSDSPDLKYWGNTQLVLGNEKVPFCNTKIGPAAPPIKTSKGWLTTFHAVKEGDKKKNGWEPFWAKEYYAGIMLLDLNEPYKVIGMYDKPLLAPETLYETSNGFRNNVIFPGGMILEDDGEVKIYYGAADTVECLATASLDELVNLCIGEKK